MTTESNYLPSTTGATSPERLSDFRLGSTELLLSERPCALNADLLPANDCHALIARHSAAGIATPAQAAKLATRLVGSFKATEVTDPDIFITTLASVFARHAYVDGLRVIDPVSGLPGKQTFSPTLNEVVAALQEQVGKRLQIVRNANWMLAERERRKKEGDRPVIPQSRRDELVAWARQKANEIVEHTKDDPHAQDRRPSPRAKARQEEWDRQAAEYRGTTWAGRIDSEAAE